MQQTYEAFEAKRSWRPFPPWPWLLGALAVVLAMGATGLALLNRPLTNPWESIFGLVMVLAYGGPGALIVVRQRGNRIGWLFLVVAVMLALQSFADQYAVYGLLIARPPLLGADFAAWLQWIGLVSFAPLSIFLLLYPNGRLPSRRWQPLLLLVLLIWVGNVLFGIIKMGPVYYYPLWGDTAIHLLEHNPTAVPVLAERLQTDGSLNGLLDELLLFLAAVTPLFRYRQGDATARKQLRWLSILVGVMLLILSLSVVGSLLSMPRLVLNPDVWLVILIVGFPLAVTVAILHHRLYDIDLLINRTLVYGSLTGMLALVYLAMVILFQSLLTTRTELATVVSTLAVAVLFAPLRERIQSIIDRRFYRRKYDAVKTLAAFGAIARDEVDLEVMTTALMNAVKETVQPVTSSLWLVPSQHAAGKRRAYRANGD
jgi:hypothetical protein